MEDFVIHYGADTSDAIRKIRELKKVNLQMAKSLGSNFQRATNIVKTSLDKVSQTKGLKKVKDGFKTVTTEVFNAGTVIQTTDGKYKNFVRTLTVTDGKLSKTKGTLADVTKQYGKTATATKTASKATKTFGENVNFLAKRAITVIPIWLALRATFMAFIQLIKSSAKFLVDWEFQMTQIKIVGKATAEQLEQVSNSLLSLSSKLGISNKKLGEGAKLFFQQGRAIKEIIPLMSATAKLSLLTGRTITQSVEDMTAILKAYKLEASDAINVVDSITSAMLNHAITAGDLASAYKQVASTASALGVSFTSLTGFITAIKSVTRDAGGKIGLSLRTMFTRIATTSALALQKLTLIPFFLDKTGKVTSQITPNMRNLENIIFDLAGAFGNLTNAQQAQVAKLIGGVRRANQVFALFNNFTEAIDTQTDSLFGLGKADTAISILTNTTKLRIEALSGAWSEFVDTVGDTGVFKDVLNILKNQIINITTILDPTKVLAIEVGKRFDEQVESLSRQKNLVNSILASIARAKSLEDILSRGGGNIELIQRQIESLVKGINKAGKDFNISVNAEIKNPEDLIESLTSQFSKLEALTIQTKIEIPVQETLKEMASLGNTVSRVIGDAILKEFNITRLFGKAKVELDEISNILKNMSLGAIIDDKEIDKLKEFSEKILTPDKQQEFLALLTQTVEKQNKVNSLLSGERTLRGGLLKEIEQKNSLIETEFQLSQKLNKIRLTGARTGEFEIDILNKQLAILDSQKDSLSDELFKQRVTIEQKIARLYYEQGQNIKKVIIANQIIQLKNSKALESTISKTRDKLIEQFNIREKIVPELARQLKIKELIVQEAKKENALLINHKLELLKLQGATSRQLMEQRILLESAFNIDRSRLDNIKSELDVQREITREKLEQGKLSGETLKLFKIAKKFGTKTASQTLSFLRGERGFPKARGSLGEEKLRNALNEFFGSVVEARKAFEFFATGKGQSIPIKEKGISLPSKPQELFFNKELQTFMTKAVSVTSALTTPVSTLMLPKIETRIENVKIELKQMLNKADLSEKLLEGLALALKDNPVIREAIENIIENY